MPHRRWTDDDLYSAIENARTWTEVLQLLGLSKGGTAHVSVRRRAAELSVDVDHLREGVGGRSTRTWTDDQLRAAVATSQNLRQVFLALDLVVGGGSWVAMKRHILRLDLDTSHWLIQLPPNGVVVRREPLPAWSDDNIRQAFEGARSVAQIMRRLGLDPLRKRGRREVERRLDELGCDRRSLLGQGASRGRRVPRERRRRRPLEEILVEDSTYTSTSYLKRRLIE